MKKQTFTVTLTFSDKMVDDNEINEIAINIADSIVHSAGTCGIVPDESEGYTETVEVTSHTTGGVVTRKTH